jgi:hypothetical protein
MYVYITYFYIQTFYMFLENLINLCIKPFILIMLNKKILLPVDFDILYFLALKIFLSL